MDAGVKTTVNTDDHRVMDSLIQECENLTTHLGVSIDDIHQCSQWAREASFQNNGFNRFGLINFPDSNTF